MRTTSAGHVLTRIFSYTHETGKENRHEQNRKQCGKALYEQQETKLSQQSAAFIELLTKRGILGDSSIDDDRVRQAKKEKKKSMYHNTLLLL